MTELCFFLVRSLDSPMEFYTVVVEGEKKSVEENLKMFFIDVRFLKTLPLNVRYAPLAEERKITLVIRR